MWPLADGTGALNYKLPVNSPTQVVNMITKLFTEFDDIVDRHGAVKVETIGDGESFLPCSRVCSYGIMRNFPQLISW